MIYGGVLDNHEARVSAYFGSLIKGTDEMEVIHSSSSYRWGPFPTADKNIGKYAIKASDRKLAKQLKAKLKPCN